MLCVEKRKVRGPMRNEEHGAVGGAKWNAFSAEKKALSFSVRVHSQFLEHLVSIFLNFLFFLLNKTVFCAT